MPSRRTRPAAVILALALAACGGGGGGGPTAASGPDVPVAISPAGGATVDSATPTLVVRNATGFDSGATYDFVVLSADAVRTVAEIDGVAAGAGQTSVGLTQPLLAGGGYQWKAVAHQGGRSVESVLAPFEVGGFGCDGTSDPWAKQVIDFDESACSLRQNRGHTDPQDVVGAPDAAGLTDASYRGFLSLGEGGHVIVDMGACIGDATGPDLRVHQYIESEPVLVRVSGSPGGPWVDLGKKACGDGGVPSRPNENHCDFDLATGGMKAARYVWVEDGELFPCAQATTRTEGADIDAVQVLTFHAAR